MNLTPITLSPAAANFENTLDQIKEIIKKSVREIGFVMVAVIREQSSKANILVCYDGDRVVGFCNSNVRKRDGVGVIYEIVVVPEYRKHGLARKMIEKLLDKAAWVELKCPVDNRSNGFYRRVGNLIGVEEGKNRNLNLYRITKETLWREA